MRDRVDHDLSPAFMQIRAQTGNRTGVPRRWPTLIAAAGSSETTSQIHFTFENRSAQRRDPVDWTLFMEHRP
jgi:hypothetical protein